ncbi:hypothetical protein ABPG72_002567 [Tetrahymena utriculariae]
MGQSYSNYSNEKNSKNTQTQNKILQDLIDSQQINETKDFEDKTNYTYFIGLKESSDEGCMNLAKNLLQIKQLQVLAIDISQRLIGLSNFQALTNSLCHHPFLQELYLYASDSFIQNEGAKYLAIPLSQMNKLIKLVLELNSNQIGQFGAKKIGFALSQKTELTYLYLGLDCNGLDYQGAYAVLSSLKDSTKLETLILKMSNYKEDQKIFDCLAQLIELNPQLQQLVLCMSLYVYNVQNFKQAITKLKKLKVLKIFTETRQQSRFIKQQLTSLNKIKYLVTKTIR